MTKLPEKEWLSGTKTPRTATGEMTDAPGKVRDGLSELPGEDSTDKEAARLALGIDLADLDGKIEARADRAGLENRASGLEEAIARKGVPVGTTGYFAMPTPPAGYPSRRGRSGKGNLPGTVTTFNLPDLTGRFPQGSPTPGQKIEAGLPNITGTIKNPSPTDTAFTFGGEWPIAGTSNPGTLTSTGNLANKAIAESNWTGGSVLGSIHFDANRSNSIYGASATVQPPALTLLPCIKAFDAATNPGLIDISALANEVAAHKHVTETYNDGTSWYRKWSDGWFE